MKVSQKTDAEVVQLRRDSEDHTACLKVANYAELEDVSAPRVPKRKLSVFYRSFDVIAASNQGDPSEFRRTSSSPSVSNEKSREIESREEICQQTSPCRKGLVNNYRLLIESGKFLSSSSPESLTSEKFSSDNAEFPSTKAVISAAFKLPQVLEDRSADNYATITDSTIGKHFKVNSGGNGEFKVSFSETLRSL